MGGAPGIGKTRLSEEFSRLAERRGFLVLWGTWREGGSGSDHAVWRQLVRGLLPRIAAPATAAGLSSALAELASLVPEIRDSVPDLPPPMKDAGPGDHARLLDAMTRALRGAARGGPVLLVLDNIHLASAESLSLAEAILGELADSPLLLVATFRNLPLHQREPLLSFLGGSRPASAARELVLANLTEEETGALLRRVAGRELSGPAVREIHRGTGGLPLFVREIARLCREKVPPGGDGTLRLLRSELPAAVSAAIGRRFGQLSPQSQDALRKVSLLGLDFGREETALLTGVLAPGALEPALDAGVDHGFLQRDGARYSFSHAVVHEAISGMIPERERRELYASVARTAETVQSADTASSPALAMEQALKVAALWSCADGSEGTGRRLAWVRRAARYALDAHAWTEAAELLRELVPGAAAAVDSDEKAADLGSLGRALFMCGRKREAVGWFRRAFPWYQQRGDVPAMIEIATMPGYLTVGEDGFFNFYGPLLDILPAGSVSRGLVMVHWATAQWNCLSDLAGARRSLEEANAIGVHHGDPLLQARALPLMGYIDKLDNHPEAGLEKLRQAEVLSQQTPDCFARAHTQGITAQLLVVMGRVEEAYPCCVRSIELAERERDSFLVAGACHDAARLAQGEGDWDGARAFLERGLSAMPEYSPLLALAATVEYATACFGAGDRFRGRLLALARRAGPGPWLAHIAAASATLARALQSGATEEIGPLRFPLQSAAVHPDAHPWVRLRAHLLLCLAAFLTDDESLARSSYAALRGLPPVYVIRPYHTERHLGLAAHAFQDHRAAERHLREALRLARHFHDRPNEAQVLHDLGCALLPGLEPDDVPREARRCLVAARDLAHMLRMTPLLQRTERVLAAISESQGRADPPHVHLSAREKQVLLMMAEGCTNKEIAQRLGISVSTASHHAQRVLEKTGAANRTEAAAIAHRRGMTVSPARQE